MLSALSAELIVQSVKFKRGRVGDGVPVMNQSTRAWSFNTRALVARF